MICVINGKGGIGKDTLIDKLALSGEYSVFNASSIDPTKDICKRFNKTGEKTNAYRELLSSVKKSVDKYYKAENGISFSNEYLLNASRFALTQMDLHDKNGVLFIHIREPENIASFVRLAKEMLEAQHDTETKVTTLLVKSDRAQETYGNESDDEVENYNYDFVYNSREGIDKDFECFMPYFKNMVFEQKFELYKTEDVLDDKSNNRLIVGETIDGSLLYLDYYTDFYIFDEGHPDPASAYTAFKSPAYTETDVKIGIPSSKCSEYAYKMDIQKGFKSKLSGIEKISLEDK